MGDNLADVLLRQKGIDIFSNATREQYNLSKELWDLLIEEKPNPTIDDVFSLAEFSLNHNDEWIQKSKERLSSIIYSNTPQLDNNSLAFRSAYDYSMISQWDKSIHIINIATPILVHKSEILDRQASPVEKMRIITPKKLAEFKKKIKEFVSAIVQDTNWQNENNIQQLLNQYKWL